LIFETETPKFLLRPTQLTLLSRGISALHH
jgi:hypothetical protein